HRQSFKVSFDEPAGCAKSHLASREPFAAISHLAVVQLKRRPRVAYWPALRMHLEEEVARAFPGWATRSAAFLRRVASDATTGSSGTVGGPSRTHFQHRLTCCLKWR